MMYILGYLRKHILQYNALPFKSFGLVKFLKISKVLIIKDVAYIFDNKNWIHIISQNNIVKYYCNV